MNISKLLLYYNTLKYLRLRQLVFNVIRRLFRKPKIADINVDINGGIKCHQLSMSMPVVYKNKIDKESVCFLNQKRSLEYIQGWACLDEPKLWRYNLHYFDFLLDDGASEEIKDSLIDSWIMASPGLKVDAWEAYPVSLRLVNWIKYFIVYKKNTI
ncbi:Heparinase II/III-like, partial [hydrothermal vent metagenome]